MPGRPEDYGFNVDDVGWRYNIQGMQIGSIGVLTVVRDAQGLVVVFTQEEWDEFKGGVKRGEFDLEALRRPRD